jgi:hypothetical protein
MLGRGKPARYRYLISGAAEVRFEVFLTLWATGSSSYLGSRLRSRKITGGKEHERQLQVLRREDE